MNDKKMSLPLATPPTASDKATPVYMSLESESFKDEPDAQCFLAHSPHNFAPKFLREVEGKSRSSVHSPKEIQTLTSTLGHFSSPLKVPTSPSIHLNLMTSEDQTGKSKVNSCLIVLFDFENSRSNQRHFFPLQSVKIDSITRRQVRAKKKFKNSLKRILKIKIKKKKIVLLWTTLQQP